jgi:hypothetical protein
VGEGNTSRLDAIIYKMFSKTDGCELSHIPYRLQCYIMYDAVTPRVTVVLPAPSPLPAGKCAEPQ